MSGVVGLEPASLSTRIAPLMQGFSLRGVDLRNRVAMAPMTREFAEAGVPTDEMAAYYARRAAGGVGLILTEGVGVAHPAAVDKPGIPVLHGEVTVQAWRRVVDAVHAVGGTIFPQLWHQGAMRDAALSLNPHIQPLRPSGIWGPEGGVVSLDTDYLSRLPPPGPPMTEEEIADAIAAYALSARAAVQAGFDGIALHGAHGYLIDNFLWHGTNRRTDRWGGATRWRFAAELVRAVRREVGEARPIVFRISQFKMQDYRASLAGTPDELGALLGPIADAGVDLFDGSQRFFDTPIFEGSPLNLAGWAKRLTGKPSMTVGGVGLDKGSGTPRHIDRGSAASDNLERLVARFERSEFDMVGVGRSLLNDPDWLQKACRGDPFAPFDPANLSRLT